MATQEQNNIIKTFLKDAGLFWQDTWLECLPEELLNKIYKFLNDDCISFFKGKHIAYDEGDRYLQQSYYYNFILKRYRKDFNLPIQFYIKGYNIKQIINNLPMHDFYTVRNYSHIKEILKILDIPYVIIPDKTMIDEDLNEIKHMRCVSIKVRKCKRRTTNYKLELFYKVGNTNYYEGVYCFYFLATYKETTKKSNTTLPSMLRQRIHYPV